MSTPTEIDFDFDRPLMSGEFRPQSAFLRQLEANRQAPVICSRTSSDISLVSKGSLVRRCGGCNSEAWLAPSSVAAMERNPKLVPCCWECAGADAEHIREIFAAMVAGFASGGGAA